MGREVGQQASAVETATRIIAGGAKAPRPTSSEAKYLVERLTEAAITLRDMEDGNDAVRTSPRR